MLRRRDLLKSTLLAAPLWNSLVDRAAAAETAARGFDYATLKGRARALASRPYKAPTNLAPEKLRDLSYDQYQAIRFQRERALWFNENRGFRLEFFHLGRGFKEPVKMYELVNGREQEILYKPGLFDLQRSGASTRGLPENLGFAGFRVHSATNWEADVAAFLGASYFRAVGSDSRQFGLSARGLAIDTANGGPEEFPRFTAFWFERPPLNSRSMVFYALMDSPSATGAFRWEMTPGPRNAMDVDASIYPRKPIDRLGIAPLTSMFQCGENDKRMANDWRPEIHDSDGLSICTGSGEWIWRPLNNPGDIRVSSYFDKGPRGFGLMQRDRNFEHYQDDGVFYNRRPSLWIEPKADWGAGAVQLVELPTVDETFDNIVAFWNPASKPKGGEELLFGYRMFWGNDAPMFQPLAHAVATRTGIGGVIGQPRRYFSWRFAVDFAGGELTMLPEGVTVEPIITASRGQVEITSARPIAYPQGDKRGYRAMFDIKPSDDRLDPIDLRMFLRCNGQPLTETWIYQWTPPSLAARRAALAQAGA
jgi:glucans biosynthesis protein